MRVLFLPFIFVFLLVANSEFAELKEEIYEIADMSKSGNLFEKKLKISEDKFYRFGFVYAQDPQIQAKEHDESEAKFPGYGDKFDQWLCTKYSIDKFAGMYAKNSVDNSYVPNGKSDEDRKICAGVGIKLRLTITPLKPVKGGLEWEYARGDGMNFADYVIENAGELSGEFDLSTYGNDLTFKAPNGGMARSKMLFVTRLKIGEYALKLEALNDTPEINEIVTYIEMRENLPSN